MREYKSFSELKEEYKNLKYSSNANYIIFRDIDLASGSFSNGKDDEWDPIMFSGNMIGAIADESHSLEDIVRQSIAGTADASVQATISNIRVETTGTMDVQKTSGVGFFATISNTSNTKVGLSDGAVVAEI